MDGANLGNAAAAAVHAAHRRNALREISAKETAIVLLR